MWPAKEVFLLTNLFKVSIAGYKKVVDDVDQTRFEGHAALRPVAGLQ